MAKNIYLVGMRGTGKSTVGKLLADKLGKTFLDMDEELIRRAGKTVTEIVDEGGWDAFRELERQLVSDLASQEDLVVGTGGGVLMFFNNGEQLRASGTNVLLVLEPDQIVARIEGSTDRPSLTGDSFLEEISEVWRQRRETYYQYADISLEDASASPEQNVEAIVEQLRAKQLLDS